MGKMKLNWEPVENLKPFQTLLCEGEGSFLIKKVYNTNKEGQPLMSSRNDPMVSIQLSVIDKNGDEGVLYDYFTCRTLWKIHNLCEAIGRPELYQPEFDYEQIVNCTGRLNIAIDSRPGYARRNSIKSYIKPNKAQESKYATPEQLAALDDSDIPF